MVYIQVPVMQNSGSLYFCMLTFVSMLTWPVFTHGNAIDRKVLHVGEQLWKETLPLQMGSCLSELKGLKPGTWYEVKSYPASIPSSVSLQLKRSSLNMGLNMGRKLLNTEKLIFKTDGIDTLSDKHGLHIVVNVKPEVVIAIAGQMERKFVIFNIVCDELFMGLPHKAWYMVLLVLLCLGLAFMVPNFLPPFLLLKNETPAITDQSFAKDS